MGRTILRRLAGQVAAASVTRADENAPVMQLAKLGDQLVSRTFEDFSMSRAATEACPDSSPTHPLYLPCGLELGSRGFPDCVDFVIGLAASGGVQAALFSASAGRARQLWYPRRFRL